MTNAVNMEAGSLRQNRRDAACSAAPGFDWNFIATFAHEVRNILSPLGMSAELLQCAGPGLPQAARRRCPAIGRAL